MAHFSAERCDVGQRVAPAVRPLRPREVCFEIKIDSPGNVRLPVVQRSRSWLREFKPAVGDDNGRIGKVLGEPLHGCWIASTL